MESSHNPNIEDQRNLNVPENQEPPVPTRWAPEKVIGCIRPKLLNMFLRKNRRLSPDDASSWAAPPEHLHFYHTALEGNLPGISPKWTTTPFQFDWSSTPNITIIEATRSILATDCIDYLRDIFLTDTQRRFALNQSKLVHKDPFTNDKKREIVLNTIPILVVDETAHRKTTFSSFRESPRCPRKVIEKAVSWGAIVLATPKPRLGEGLSYVFSALTRGEDPRMKAVNHATWNEQDIICV